jgi:hypothetical protein
MAAGTMPSMSSARVCEPITAQHAAFIRRIDTDVAGDEFLGFSSSCKRGKVLAVRHGVRSTWRKQKVDARGGGYQTGQGCFRAADQASAENLS